MRIYFDTRCLNRPFDDQTQDRIHLESEAIRLVFQHVEKGGFVMISSRMLEYEVERIHDDDRRSAIQAILSAAKENVPLTDAVLTLAERLESEGIHSFDALQLASASEGKVDVFLTVDDRLYNKAGIVESITGMKVDNPLRWVQDLPGGRP